MKESTAKERSPPAPEKIRKVGITYLPRAERKGHIKDPNACNTKRLKTRELSKTHKRL